MVGKDNLVLKEKKVYILKNKELRLKIIWLYHDIPVARHGEQRKTTEMVTRNY